MTRNVRRVAAGAILIAVACNVYDPSLLVGGGTSGSGGSDVPGGTGGVVSGGTGGAGGTGGSTGGSLGGSSVVGGSGGTVAGAGGTTGGNSGAGATSGGSGGSDAMAGEGGEAGVMGEGGTGGSAGGSSGMGGAGGSGGSAGTGAGGMATGGGAGTGTSGAGGAAGMSGSGGSAGSSAGMAGAAGAGSGRTGCAVLTVPLAAGGDKSHFDISFSPTLDLSGATITMQVYVSAGNGGIIDPFAQDSNYHFLNPATVQQISSFIGAGWTKPIVWNFGAEPPRSTSIVKTAVKRIGVEISANNAATSTLANTVVYIDSITIDTPAESLTFDASGSVTGTALSGDPSSTEMWINSSDTPVANTSLAWQATCP